jgi:hypothetical protein
MVVVRRAELLDEPAGRNRTQRADEEVDRNQHTQRGAANCRSRRTNTASPPSRNTGRSSAWVPVVAVIQVSFRAIPRAGPRRGGRQLTWVRRAVCGLQERLQGGSSRGFLFDGVPACKAAAGENTHRVGTFRGRRDSVAGQGAEGFALVVLARSDVDDHATGVRREVVMDSSRDADSAEVGLHGTDHDVVDADGGLVDQVKERVRWLAVAPEVAVVGRPVVFASRWPDDQQGQAAGSSLGVVGRLCPRGGRGRG